MDEFTMSAFARYADGSTGDAFAEVHAKTPVACFAAMAAEVARWMPAALCAERGEVPEAIELTLAWRGEAAACAALALPHGPHDEGELEVRLDDVKPFSAQRRRPHCHSLRPLRAPARSLPRGRRRIALPRLRVRAA